MQVKCTPYLTLGHEPKESFASALKKRLTRGGKKRSQSADRAKLHSQSLHEGGSYLRPPGDSSYGYRTTGNLHLCSILANTVY
jgi:hypothetical protein